MLGVLAQGRELPEMYKLVVPLYHTPNMNKIGPRVLESLLRVEKGGPRVGEAAAAPEITLGNAYASQRQSAAAAQAERVGVRGQPGRPMEVRWFGRETDESHISRRSRTAREDWCAGAARGGPEFGERGPANQG